MCAHSCGAAQRTKCVCARVLCVCAHRHLCVCVCARAHTEHTTLHRQPLHADPAARHDTRDRRISFPVCGRRARAKRVLVVLAPVLVLAAAAAAAAMFPCCCLAPSCPQCGLLRSTWSCVCVSPSSSLLRESSPSPQVSTALSRSACPARTQGNRACAALFVMAFVDHFVALYSRRVCRPARGFLGPCRQSPPRHGLPPFVGHWYVDMTKDRLSVRPLSICLSCCLFLSVCLSVFCTHRSECECMCLPSVRILRLA